MKYLWSTLAACLFATAAAAAGPDNYPNRAVKVIVPFAPAGPTDLMARIIAQKLSENLGQQFYVENKVGAGGNIGMVAAAKSKPDGYTILVASSSFVVNPSLYASNPYDPYKDFTPLMRAAASPNVLVVNPGVPAKTVAELIEITKKDPDKYSVANPGIGTTPQLAAELFKLTFKLDSASVPFSGASPAVTSAMAGHTPVAFAALPPAAPLIAAGQLRALAVTSPKRTALLPDVPTMLESGFKNQESETMQGVFLPADAPKELVAFLHAEIAKVMALPDVKEKCVQLGFEVVADTPEQFATYIKAEVDKWARVIKDAKIEKIQ